MYPVCRLEQLKVYLLLIVSVSEACVQANPTLLIGLIVLKHIYLNQLLISWTEKKETKKIIHYYEL